MYIWNQLFNKCKCFLYLFIFMESKSRLKAIVKTTQQVILHTVNCKFISCLFFQFGPKDKSCFQKTAVTKYRIPYKILKMQQLQTFVQHLTIVQCKFIQYCSCIHLALYHKMLFCVWWKCYTWHKKNKNTIKAICIVPVNSVCLFFLYKTVVISLNIQIISNWKTILCTFRNLLKQNDKSFSLWKQWQIKGTM